MPRPRMPHTVVLAVVVAALGYFVDIFDLLLFALVRKQSLTEILGPQIAALRQSMAPELARCVDDAARDQLFAIRLADFLRDWGGWLDNVLQTTGLMVGGLAWGILADRRGRIAVLFGSILCYSIANIMNGLIADVGPDDAFGFLHSIGLGTAIRQYEVLRFLAGFGLAGELGAGITLVSELVDREHRGYATTIVATVGILGAVVGYYVTQMFAWRTAFFVGGVLGLGLLVLRVGVVESGMFTQAQKSHTRGRGAFWKLMWPPERFKRYAGVVLMAVPIWFVVGSLMKYCDVLGLAMGMDAQHQPSAALAVMWCYSGLAAGDLCSGLLSQLLRSRRRAMGVFHLLTIAGIVLYFTVAPRDLRIFYGVAAFLGFASGYWAVFVTSAAEQFGTNIRGTAATTAPNLVRWSAAGSLFLWLSVERFLAGMGVAEAAAKWQGAAIASALVMVVAIIGLWTIRETFGVSLDFVET